MHERLAEKESLPEQVMLHQPLRHLTLLLLLISGCSTPPSEDNLVGKSEAAVRSEFGQPHRESKGHYGAPPTTFAQKFTDEIKTLVFQQPGGEIYVSFEKRGDTWVAICNSWLPEGSAF